MTKKKSECPSRRLFRLVTGCVNILLKPCLVRFANVLDTTDLALVKRLKCQEWARESGLDLGAHEWFNLMGPATRVLLGRR